MEQHGNDIFNILPNPCLILDTDYHGLPIINVNTAFVSLIGESENNLFGKDFLDVFASDTDFEQNNWENLFERATREGISVKIPVLKHQRKLTGSEDDKGTQRYLTGNISPVLDSNGIVYQLICSFTDVTEFGLARAYDYDAPHNHNVELLKETRRFSKTGIWEANLTNNTIAWSDLTKEIYEVDQDFIPSFDDVIGFIRNDVDRESFVRLVKEAMLNGAAIDAELQITTGKGNVRFIRISGQAGSKQERQERIFGGVHDITNQKHSEYLLAQSQNRIELLIKSLNGIFWEADAQTCKFSFVSDHVNDILGFTPEEWLRDRHFWESHIHPEDLQQAVSYCQDQTRNAKDYINDYRMIKSDGNVIWIKDVVSVIIENGMPTYLRGLMIDVTEDKRIEELAVLEKTVLQINTTNDTSLNELLIIYLEGIEKIFPGIHCSFHKVQEDYLALALAPSISSAYLQELHNLPIGPMVGSCGTAAFLKERVIVSDIANDPRWAGYYDLALKFNLRACWSQPIISSDGVVLATLGFYYNQVRIPEENELIVIERCAAILKVIIENRQNSVLLEEATLAMKQGQELAGFGNWQWDISTNLVHWSDELYHIYGLSKSTFKATFEGYQELLHPNDRERVVAGILQVLRDKNDIVFEERIIRANGEIRHLKSWGRLLLDEEGVPVKMVGACLDVTENRQYLKEIEQQNENLKSIAFMQSHVVRAPLARLMGAVDLIKNYNNSVQESKEFMNFILTSAHELDRIIRDISEKTKNEIISDLG